MTWTDEAVELLRAKAAQGCSGSQIAIALGIRSRNAVIGKAMRLGVRLHGEQCNIGVWVSRPSVSRRRSRIGLGVRIRSAKHKMVRRVEQASGVESLWLTLAELCPTSCRFPKGTPGEEDFRYCGAPKAVGPYCLCHHNLTHQAA